MSPSPDLGGIERDDDLLERLRPGYRAMSEGRVDEWLALLDPEVELCQDDAIPGTAGTFAGHAGARAMIAELDEAWEDIRWEPLEALPLDDGRYLVRVGVSGIGRESRIPLEGELGHLITVRDRRTVRLDVHRDWDAARRAAGIG